jgi:3-hydroxyacyl-[acyl-carrier-protein] dehydratase
MLLGNFYQLVNSTTEENGYRAQVKLNAAHPIFEGHFPGSPVVPGVCQLQMVEEMLTHLSGIKKRLKTTDNVKFLHTVNPLIADLVDMELLVTEREGLPTEVNATYQWNGMMVFKFKGFFE